MGMKAYQVYLEGKRVNSIKEREIESALNDVLISTPEYGAVSITFTFHQGQVTKIDKSTSISKKLL